MTMPETARLLLAHQAVIARQLSGWAVDDDCQHWYHRHHNPYQTELMTDSEVEIVRSVLATLHKDTP